MTIKKIPTENLDWNQFIICNKINEIIDALSGKEKKDKIKELFKTMQEDVASSHCLSDSYLEEISKLL